MMKIDNILRKVIPRFYTCPDVVVVMWLGYEWIIRR